jgi:hypothetical protein
MDGIADHEKAPESLVFAQKVPSLPSLRAFTQTSVMRDKNAFPFRERVTPNRFKTRQTRQMQFSATNSN